MTREDLSLDISFFLDRESVLLFRIARARYANLSGIGAASAPGRWNMPGQEAIYTSTEVGVPVLERLVHTPKDLIPSNLALMRIRMSGQWKLQGVHLFDADTGGIVICYRSLAEARASASLFRGAAPFAIAVPSVVVPVWNVVLYPTAPGFNEHISLEHVEPFEFDPRLFPDNAGLEPPVI